MKQILKLNKENPMRERIFKKLKMMMLVLAAFIFIAVAGVESARADSTHMDGKGDSFVLGKSGARMKMKLSYGDDVIGQVVIVGKLGDRYVAMLDHNNQDSKLNGKLFMVDNICVGHNDLEDGIGTCTWDGNSTSIINIENINLDNMTYTFPDWPKKYMQIFWFDLREKFEDEPELWAISSSCYSHDCKLFKYTESYTEDGKILTERKLEYRGSWSFGNIVRGIDVLDINSMLVDPMPSDRRCPPIFVQVSRPAGNNGVNNNFWTVSSSIYFHNILKGNELPHRDPAFGNYIMDYKPLGTFDPSKIMDSVSKGEQKFVRGICGGGISALGLYNDTNKSTFTYHTMESHARFKNGKGSGGDAYYYDWNMKTVPHTFEYDKQKSLFTKVQSGNNSRYACWSFAEGGSKSKVKEDLAELYRSCDSIYFNNRGPALTLEKNDLEIKGNEMNGTKVRGGVKALFEKGSKTNSFVGKLKLGQNDKRELIGKDEYIDSENSIKNRNEGEALRRCDEQGRQVLAIFLGYPVTAVNDNQTSNANKTQLSVNFGNVKTQGVETESGVNAGWSAGMGKECKRLPFEYHVGYQGFLNNMVKENDGSSFSGDLTISKNFDKLSDYRNKGTIIYTKKLPVLLTGELVWEDNEEMTYPEVKGLGTVVQLSGGVRTDKNSGQIDMNHFDLYNPDTTWDESTEVYSAMSDGLEKKTIEFNNGNGNLFEFDNEKDLISQVSMASNENYNILDELKKLANDEEKIYAGKDTFKDRPVKWLAPESPGKYFRYGWKSDFNFQMEFSTFKNSDDIVEQGHGGYWKFKLGLAETEGEVTVKSTSRTYTNSTTKNGYGFTTPSVDYNLTNDYSICYWGFNVNPQAYKQMKVNKNEKPERPGFIPKYCWDRDQSFVLFVPEVEGSSVHMNLI